MTMRQRKGIRAVVLTLMLLLLAITTFDSRNGFFVAQADPSDSLSDANMDMRKVEPISSDQRLAIPQAPPQTVLQAAPQVSPKTVEIEKVVKVEKVVEKIPEVMIDVPVEVEKIAKVVENAQVPVKVKPDPNPWESSDVGGDDSHIDTKRDLQPGSKRKHDPDPGPDPGLEPDPDPDPGTGLKPDPGDDPCTGAKGDRNRGHGNDEGGYDEDNPGRGGSDGVGSSRGRRGNRASGSREGHEGRGGRGNSCDRGDSKGRR